MPEMQWEKAIRKVLAERGEAMHYADIAQEIAERGLRKSLGATPHSTVNALISVSLNKRGEQSPYLSTGPGMYMLRGTASAAKNVSSKPETDSAPTGLVRSLGMFWNANRVAWKASPRLLGQAQAGSDPVDFSDQRGVYLLLDRDRVIYAGRAVERGLGPRLAEHRRDRLNGRWDRFSWFGLRAVDDKGALGAVAMPEVGPELLIATMETILIEALEPPQNRKRGDLYAATEYLQADDPDRDREKNVAIESLMGLLGRR